MCHYDGKIKQIWAKIDPTSFQAGFWRNCELRLGTFSWIVSQLDCKWKLEYLFCPWPWKMQGNWENWRNSFWWSANREFFLSENDFKRSSEIQKFSRENVDIFWWSANRDKICKVVRESEKVENRWPRLTLCWHCQEYCSLPVLEWQTTRLSTEWLNKLLVN